MTRRSPPLGPDGLPHDPTVPRRRRRPTGEPSPLPHDIGMSGRGWIALALVAAAVAVLATVWERSASVSDRVESSLLQDLATLRVGWLTWVMRALSALGSAWTLRFLRWGTILALVGFRRWRHLLVFLGSVLVVELGAYRLSILLGRPRPIGVEILGGWQGFSMPSRPVAGLAVTLVGMAGALVAGGSARLKAEWIAGALVAALALSRLYLAVDHPTDVTFAVALGVLVPVVAFRWFVPDEAFPVTYGRGRSAHLDVGGRRGLAIREAVCEQLGLVVEQIKPIGLQGSGGSTPLRLHVVGEDGQPRFVFAKLYAQSHARADRWYKIGRTILYGALEDETHFDSVHRMSIYEDYALRLLRDAGIPSAAPLGVVMITHGRECMLVSEFLRGAKEIGRAEIDDSVINSALEIVRKLWDAGLAHRDIKPANLLVRDGQVFLIDAFFLEVRPSAWRQAVDLGNMMILLSLRTDARRVYDRALRLFTEDEIAEAFAATRSVAIPRQLNVEMRRAGRDLPAELRALAPPRPLISVQRWSVRRIVLTLAVLAGIALAILLVVSNWNVFA